MSSAEAWRRGSALPRPREQRRLAAQPDPPESESRGWCAAPLPSGRELFEHVAADEAIQLSAGGHHLGDVCGARGAVGEVLLEGVAFDPAQRAEKVDTVVVVEVGAHGIASSPSGPVSRAHWCLLVERHARHRGRSGCVRVGVGAAARAGRG